MEVGGLQISAALPSASPERATPSPLHLRHHLFPSLSHGAPASFQSFCALATPISSVRVGHRAVSMESSSQRARVVYSGGAGEDTTPGIGEEAATSTSSPASSSPYVVATAALLSLSEKPDRSVALLDEYEMEELDPPDPNHRSGTDSRAACVAFLYHDIIVAWSFILVCCLLFTPMVKVRDFVQSNPVDSSNLQPETEGAPKLCMHQTPFILQNGDRVHSSCRRQNLTSPLESLISILGYDMLHAWSCCY